MVDREAVGGRRMGRDPRLLALAELVPPGLAVADVGTGGRAALARLLVASGRSPGAVGIEASHPTWQAAADLVARRGPVEVAVRRGRGVAPLSSGEAAVLVAAGLGGRGIIDLLEEAGPRLGEFRRLVLGPQRDAAVLRRWLAERGFRLAWEELVAARRRIYELIAAEPGVEPASGAELEIGPRLLERRHPLLANLLRYRVQRLEAAAAQAAWAGNEQAASRLFEAARRLRKVGETWLSLRI